MKHAFAGITTLIKLALRRDRLKLGLWVGGISLTLLGTISGVKAVYDEPVEWATYATTALSNMGLFFNGPLDSPRIESIALTESMTFMSIFIGLMSTLLVIRHTRQNEETGRSELIGAGEVGRYAPLGAALAVAVAANLLLSLLVALILLAQGFALDGSLLAGLSFGMIGCVFAGIAAVAAQLTVTARAANGLAGASIGFFFLVRAIGDMQGRVDFASLSSESGWLSWLSPIGIARATQAYVANKWWVLGILVLLFVAFGAVAAILASRRDIGAGMLGVRNGRPAAKPGLLSNFGLAWRLQRGLLLGWACGMVVLAVTFGSVVEEVKKFTSASGDIAEVISLLGNSQDLVDAYLGFSLMLFGVAASAYGIQAFLRVRAEESQGHLEPLMATTSSRFGWLASHVIIVGLGATLLLVASGLLTALAYGATSPVELWPTIAELTAATLVYLPAALLFIGLGVLAFGVFPGWAVALPWIAFAASYVILQFSPILNLPDWVANLSPFSHIPLLPVESLTWIPLFTMGGIAASLGLVGILAFKQRDIQTN